MTQAPAVGSEPEQKRDGASETTVTERRNRLRDAADTDTAREEKERRDRDAGDVADDLADFA